MDCPEIQTKRPADRSVSGKRNAIIIGAGPAGLTAAYELLKRTDIIPVILEKSGDIGGISKTVNYKGNRIDIGGHRFFSKSNRVMNWWFNIMPVQVEEPSTFNISYQNKSREVDTTSIGLTDNEGKDPDNIMLVRRRLSRIYFLRKFFSYPIQLSLETLTKLGLRTTIAIMFAYLKAQLLPRKPEKNLEDFMVNRFGKVLYKLFFKDYTEKVWGLPCNKISAEWGAQRIKGVSISKAIQHAVQAAIKRKKKQNSNDISQKDTETSLIEQFLYPKLGPGQLWEEVARQVEEMGGRILRHHDVKRIYTNDGNNQVTAIAAINNITGETSYLEGDYFFSTMPVKELIGGLDGAVPDDVKEIAAGLQYRDFITVGILLKKLSFQDKKTGEWKPLQLKDTWIYIQEKDVKVGRLQLFNNWSPYMVKDPETVWVGMEFFCNTTDDFWNKADEDIKQLAIRELEKIGLTSAANVLDATVLRMEKTYPAYFGTYEQFHLVRDYVDRFENLFLVGRNGMHKYNNSDHSMLTAMVAVDNIVTGVASKANIWAINTEQEYHEEKATDQADVSEISKNSRYSALRWKMEKSLGFAHFIFHENYRNLRIIFLLSTLLFAVFKLFYPFPDFYYQDSTLYILAAQKHLNAGMWPIGYSKFLSWAGPIAHFGWALTAFQYMLFVGCACYFYFTLQYFYRPSAIVQKILFFFLFTNPLFFFLNNQVLSDGIFTSLSFVWMAHLIWIANRPSRRQVAVHAILLLILFSFRYNALYYPFISALAYLLSRHTIFFKITGILAPLILIGLFMFYTEREIGRMTGSRQFSPFSGWQLANNALYMYDHVHREKEVAMPDKFKELDELVRKYFSMVPPHRSLFDHPNQGTYYMWVEDAPLKLYMNRKWRNDTTSVYFERWASMAPTYAAYGSYLIKTYPLDFVRYYLLPNSIRYMTPPLEAFRFYNATRDTVEAGIDNWFGYKVNKVHSVSKTLHGKFFIAYQALFFLFNVYFLVSVVILLFNREYWYSLGRLSALIWLVVVYWGVNFSFSVMASPVVFRYQIFAMALMISFSLIISEFLIRQEKETKEAVREMKIGGYEFQV